MNTPDKTDSPMAILVVEDNERVADVIVQSLYRLGHINIKVACGGKEALEMFQRSQPDLVIMDIDMPEMDGIETARRLISHRPCPIIFSTGLWDEATLRRSREIPRSGYLVKPFSPAQLQAAIHLAD